MRALLRIPLYAASLPCDLPTWLLLLVCRLLFGRRLIWISGVLALELDDASLLQRLILRLWPDWGGSTLSPHALLFRSGDLELLLPHELIHVEQGEAIAVIAATLAGLAFRDGARLTAGVVLLLPTLQHLGGWIAALLRGEHPYRGSHLEEAAYCGDGREGRF